MLKKKWLLTSCLILVMGLTACEDGENSDSPPELSAEDTPVSQEAKDENMNKYYNVKISANEAYDIFINNKLSSTVTEISLNYDDANYYYEVEGYDDAYEYELKIDAMTGEIIKLEEQSNDKRNPEIKRSNLENIDKIIDGAIEDSGKVFESLEWQLKIVKDKTVLEIEIEKENEDLEYIYELETEKLLEKDQ